MLRDTILYSHNNLTIEEVYDTLYSKEKMKHLIASECHGDGFIVDDDHVRDKSKSNFKFYIYCKRDTWLQINNQQIKIDYKSTIKNLGEATIAKNHNSDRELLFIFTTIPNLTRLEFLTHLAFFIGLPIKNYFQHMKKFHKVILWPVLIHLVK